MAHPHISPPRPAPVHPCTRHRPQRHSAPGTAPLGCSVAVACTLFPETPRAATAPRHSAAALPPGFPCLVLASRRSIWQGTHRSPARVGRWCVDLVPLLLVGWRRSWTVMESRRRLEQASAAPHAAPPRPRPPSRSPCSARLMSAASMACTRPPVGTASCTSATAHRAGFRRPREGFIRSLRGVHRSRHHPHAPRTLGPTPSCRPTSAEERADVRKKTC